MSVSAHISTIIRLGLISLLLLLVTECFTRLFVTYPSVSRFDSVLEWSYAPYAQVFDASEGGARLQLNSFGLNEEELSNEKTKQRVLVLGDSFAMARQVERSQNFVSLSTKHSPCLQFVNAGRDAIQPFQMMELRDRLKKPLQIDSLLLVMNTNDIFGIDARVTILKGADGEIHWKQHVHHESLLRKLIDPFIKHSALAAHLASRLKVAMEEPKRSSKPRGPRELADSKRHTLRAFLNAMKEEDSYRILYIPAMTFAANRSADMTPDAWTAWNVLKEESSSAGIPTINLAPFIAESFSETGQPPVGFPNRIIGNIHLNPEGHLAATKAILELYQDNCK